MQFITNDDCSDQSCSRLFSRARHAFKESFSQWNLALISFIFLSLLQLDDEPGSLKWATVLWLFRHYFLKIVISLCQQMKKCPLFKVICSQSILNS